MNKEKEISRNAAEITLNRVEKYEQLDAPTPEEREEVFKKKTLELWDRFAVQGLFNPRTGRIDTFTDLDGRGALGLLRRAGILDPENYAIYNRTVEKKSDRSQVISKTVEGKSIVQKKTHKIISYVPAGETIPGAIHIDTGHRDGIVSDEDVSAFFDHHGPESGTDSSATRKVHEALTSLGLLEKDPLLEKAVSFITMIDNGTFPHAEKYFLDFHRTVLGLERFIQFEKLYQFFKDGHQSTDLLSPEELRKYGLDKGSEKQKAIEERSVEEFKQFEKNGFTIPTKNGGKALVAINRRFSGGYLGAAYFGAKVYVIWNPAKKNFFISNNEEGLALHLSQGRNIRGKMWIKPKYDPVPLKISLKEVIQQIAKPDFVPTKQLDEYLKNENK
ncbi:MAG: hypothetical protein Q8R26_03630 [bacterium]|nr:hypothetical protein [bacterium]